MSCHYRLCYWQNVDKGGSHNLWPPPLSTCHFTPGDFDFVSDCGTNRRDCSQNNLPARNKMAPCIPSDKWDEVKSIAVDYKGFKVVDIKPLKIICPGFFVGCTRPIFLVIKKRSIPESEYFMVCGNKPENYKPTIETNNNRTYLIKLDYLEQRHLLLTGSSDEAPPILHLEAKEKFKDANGQILEVEVRGRRKRSFIFYRIFQETVGTTIFLHSILESVNLKRCGQEINLICLRFQFLHFYFIWNSLFVEN